MATIETAIEDLQRKWDQLRQEFASSQRQHSALGKGVEELREMMAQLQNRLDEWENKERARRQWARRLAGIEIPNSSTHQRRAFA